LTTLVLAVASLFLSRAWCRYVCPWGQVMGWCHAVSRLRIVATGACHACGQCDRVCRVGAIHGGHIRTSECQFCMACVDGCPHHALEVQDVWKRAGR
jgi:polyferredoxin